jgi:CBS domain-containing protein
MNISPLVSTEFVSRDVETPVSKLAGLFDAPELKAVVVTDADGYRGVVTRRQLLTSHRAPRAKAASVLWHVPTVDPDADVREVARLMVGGDSMVLPVFEDEALVGVVTGDDLLAAVREHLDVLTVDDVCSTDLVTVAPDSTLGEALHAFREHRITHLPVVEGGSLAGIVSIHDVVGFTTRKPVQPQGGTAAPLAGSTTGRGGFGAREGDRDRLLDLPVRDVMVAPVGTTTADEPLGAAVGEMFAQGGSSLVVVEDERPTGIVTKTDALLSLTLEEEAHRPVTVVGVDYLDDVEYEEVVAMVDDLAARYAEMTVLEARVHLQKHDEALRGVPRLLARVRLYTDRGHFIASGEGYGTRHALALAANALERQILEGKTYGQSKKHPEQEYWDRIYGWYLSP